MHLREVERKEEVEVVFRAAAATLEIHFRLYPNLPQFGGQMQIQKVTTDGQDVPKQPTNKYHLLQ
jgi:hypothetical protein